MEKKIFSLVIVVLVCACRLPFTQIGAQILFSAWFHDRAAGTAAGASTQTKAKKNREEMTEVSPEIF